MHSRINVVTLAVADLDRSLAFYRALGLESPGVIGTEFPGSDTEPAGDAAMFQLEGGMTLSLYPRTELAKDAEIGASPPESGEFSIGQLVESEEEVDAVIGQARRAGATVSEAPRHRPWGIYSGYFADPDGHLWEVIHFPQQPTDGS